MDIGWQVAFALFGVLQVVAVLLLSLIFKKLDRMDDRVNAVSKRVAHLEGRLQIVPADC